MRHDKSIAMIALALSAVACGWRRTPVPVISDSYSIRALVGNWSGLYSSEETGRSGSIMFELASDKDTAYGDVVMIPRSNVVASFSSEHPGTAITPVQKPGEPLTIRFVRMSGGSVSGTLAPYDDPDCACRVVTTFAGRFTDANTIEGTYLTQGTSIGYQPSAGQWKVTRQSTTTINDAPR
jgi:hypothetical protein